MRFLSQRPVTSLPKTEDRADLGSDLLEGLAHRTETRVHPRSYSPNAGEFLRTSDDASMASPFCWKTSRWRGTNEAVNQSQLPHDVEMTLTRNYGETAAEKSTELLAVVFVSVLIAFTLAATNYSSSSSPSLIFPSAS